MKSVRERYLTDAAFRYIVEGMRAILSGAMLTPSEVREAAMLACILEEERRPAAPFTCSDEEMERMRLSIRPSRKVREELLRATGCDCGASMIQPGTDLESHSDNCAIRRRT